VAATESYAPLLEELGFVASSDRAGHWLRAGRTARDQGWKLHVSSRSDRVPELLAQIAPVLRAAEAPFKVARSTDVVRRINGGDLGRSQVGKVVTVYPHDDDEAVELGGRLAAVLSGFPGPVLEHEIRLAPDSPVYARFGSFRHRRQRTSLGLWIEVVDDGAGAAIPELRSVSMHDALGIEHPFPGGTVWSVGPLLAGRFLVVGPISRRGPRTVLVGVDVDSGERCAVKVAKRHAALDLVGDDAADRLRREWALLADLAGTDVVPCPLWFADTPEAALLAADFCAGGTLAEHARGIPDARRHAAAAALTMELIQLVERVHAAGVILGDLTPANLVLDAGGRLRYVDLELASRTAEARARGAGTIGFAAPAVFAHERPCRAHDLYALAAVIYHLATGIDLATVPQYDALLREGHMLPMPWRAVIAPLLAGPQDASARRLHAARLAVARVDGGGRAAAPTVHVAPERSSRRRELVELGRSVAALADWGTDAPGAWVSRHPSTLGDSFRDFYMGDAGIGFALLRIGLATGDLELVEAAVRCAERLAASPGPDDDLLPGLFIGEAGVGLLFLALYEVLGDPAWLRRAEQVSARIAPLPQHTPDLLHGSAGRGVFHLWLYESSGEARELARAIAIAEHLHATAERGADGAVWKLPDGFADLSQHAFYGLAHGSAGVAYFLAELATVEPDAVDARLVADVRRALRGAHAWNPLIGAADHRHAPGGAFRSGTWCHGSVGISLASLRLYEAFGRDDDLAGALAAAGSALAVAYRLGPTQCHGLAGLVELCLSIQTVTEEARHLAVARQLATRLLAAFRTQGPTGPMICAESADVVTAEFMIGASGAAAAVARVEDPRRFGHYLRGPRQAFRPIAAAAHERGKERIAR
jgi:hypothetical protein